MKLNFENYKKTLSTTFTKLKAAHFGDWFKGYLYTTMLIAFLLVSILLLFFLLSGWITQLFSSNDEIRVFVFLIAAYIAIAIIASIVWAFTAVVFFRYIPIVYLILYSGAISFGITVHIANFLSIYRVVPTTFLVSTFACFFLLASLAHYCVIKIVLYNMSKRLNNL